MAAADDRRISASDDNFRQSQVAFVANAPRGEARLTRDLQIVCCGLPSADFNFASARPDLTDLPPAIETAAGYFADCGLPFHWKLDSRSASRHGPTLIEAGYVDDGDPTPAMLLDLDPATAQAARARAAQAAPGLEVREVDGPEDRARFAETAFAGFGLPAAIAHDFLSDALHGLPAFRFFLGRVDAAPVCTAALFQTAGVAGIYWVATLENHRARGYGEAVTWAAIAAGAECGCSLASLQASKAGARVYARMGFTHVFDYRRYDPPDRSATASQVGG